MYVRVRAGVMQSLAANGTTQHPLPRLGLLGLVRQPPMAAAAYINIPAQFSQDR